MNRVLSTSKGIVTSVAAHPAMEPFAKSIIGVESKESKVDRDCVLCVRAASSSNVVN